MLESGYGSVLRLDRWYGEVAQLIFPALDPSPPALDPSERVWRRMDVPGLQLPGTATGPRFQLTAKPESRYSTFLLDTVTGQSWYLTYENQNGEQVNVWRPLGEV
jgi:hypothetical protein